MPIYEYLCFECKEKFEVLRQMKDADEPVACVYCNGKDVNRVLSVFNAQSGGRVVAGSNAGCAGCAATSCSTCSR